MRTLLVVVLLVVGGAPAHAQVVFPADDTYVPLRCRNAVMTDAFADQAAALDDRDVVGDPAAPAGLRASDDTNLYLRIRIEDDPVMGAILRPYAWGMEFDLDGGRTDYELLVIVDATGGGQDNVLVFQNTATTLANDPRDPADLPPAATFPFAMNGRTVTAAGSANGGGPDFFVDFAVPWTTLIPLGLDRATPTSVWVASSNSPNLLDGDFACHDGATGAAMLDGTASDPTTGDPHNTTPPIGTGHLEGGGGCSTGRGAASWPVLAVALGWLCRLRRVRRRRFRTA